jgi:hypothetical protein
VRRLLFFISSSLIIGLIYLIGWSSFLTITSVTIETTDPKNVALIEAELGSAGLTLGVGEPLARINTRAIERSLKEEPWIGEVTLERDWIGGEVRLFVRERIPRFIVTASLPMIGSSLSGGSGVETNRSAEFMTDDGTLFALPGDLAAEYEDLPAIEIRSEATLDRRNAAELFAAIDERFPTRKVIVTSISTFITESAVPLSTTAESDQESRAVRLVRVSWGGLTEVEAKAVVIQELMKLKANREVSQIDVSNPRLPIVSR